MEVTCMKLNYALVSVALGLAACSSSVMVKVPPRMAVEQNQTVGILAFNVEGTDKGDHNVTGKFMESIHEGQPGTPLLELGTVADVLRQVGETQLTPYAVREIGERFNVDVLLVGDLELKQSRPKVDVNLDKGLKLDQLQAKIRLDGTLNARLLNTNSGATIWTGSSARWINLANVGGSSGGAISVSVPDSERQTEKLVYDMAREASSDFRWSWERQPKQ
jgi:hypothetical protein